MKNLCVDGVTLDDSISNFCVDGTDAEMCVDGTLVYQVAVVTLTAPILSTSPPMPDVTVGNAYSYTPINSGGFSNTWSATGLPPGVTINPVTGVLSGTPTTAGTYTPVITATNAAGSDTFTDTFVISLALVAPNITTSPAFPAATQGIAFSWTPTNTGGAATSYVLQSGTLPAGLTLNPVTGVISGTPTVSGSFAITVRATNAAGSSDYAGTIVVSAAATVLSFSQGPTLYLDHTTPSVNATPCTITFQPDGTWTTVANNASLDPAWPDVGGNPTGTWASPTSAGLAGLYEIVAAETFFSSGTKIGATPSTNTLSVNRTFGIRAPATYQEQRDFSFTIREIANPANSITFAVVTQSTKF